MANSHYSWMDKVVGGLNFYEKTHLNYIKIYLICDIEIREIGHFIPDNSAWGHLSEKESESEDGGQRTPPNITWSKL